MEDTFGEKVYSMKKLFSKKIFITAGIIVGVLIIAAIVPKELRKNSSEISIKPKNEYDRKLLVVADKDYEPYSFYDKKGNPTGYDIEFLYALANELQVNVEVRLMNWRDCKAAVLNGSADMVLGLDHQMDDKYSYIYSIAMNSDRFVCFGKKKYSIVGELYDSKLATLDQGGSLTAFLEPYGLLENTTCYPSYTEAFESVLSGENDFVIARYAVGASILARMGNTGMGPVGPSLANNSMCFGMNKEDLELQKEVNQGIKVLIENGTLEKLTQKWLGEYKEITSIRDFFGIYHETVVVMIAGIILFFLLLTYFYIQKTKVVKKEYEFTSRRLEYQQLLGEATKGLYENIYEIDITHNKAVGESTEHYFEGLGLPKHGSYDEAVRIILEKQIKDEFVEGYLNMFLSEKVLETYQKGINSLKYDFMICSGDGEYYWMRNFARIFFWNSDRSIRMILYRQNIDSEKKREQQLVEEAQQDAMTQLYNKAFTEKIVRRLLSARKETTCYIALFMVDIDNFKNVNDSFGHAFGDYVITGFARVIRESAGHNDIVGRFGGDEFLMFMQEVTDLVWVQEKLLELNQALSQEVSMNGSTCKISASIGAAVCKPGELEFEELYHRADQALYVAKKKGKDGSHIY